jgi:hypothetical protein
VSKVRAAKKYTPADYALVITVPLACHRNSRADTRTNTAVVQPNTWRCMFVELLRTAAENQHRFF